VAELEGTAAHDKLMGRVQHPADAPTRVRLLLLDCISLLSALSALCATLPHALHYSPWPAAPAFHTTWLLAHMQHKRQTCC
jgi:hypothetical protein